MAKVKFIALLVALAMSAPASADWTDYGADPRGTRYSAANQITPQNVGRLKQAWVYRTGHLSAGEDAVRRSKFQATPILAEGKLVLCTPFNQVVAVDPGTGKEIWRHDPKLDTSVRYANGLNCRGVTAWRDPAAPAGQACAARIFMGTNDRRLIALDLATGRPCPGFGDKGQVTIDPGMSLLWPGEFQITSPPVVAGDVVVVGSAISDNARRVAPGGAVRAFDVRTGAPAWSWDPVPREAAAAAALGWPADVTPTEGHANAWAPMAVDPLRGLIFVPTSSPSPDFFGGARAGDNRWSDSVVALEAATGKLRWGFQTVHHDVWDYDLPAQPLLATITKDGARRDVVIQVAKTGLVFTLDRETGRPVFPVEERPVPQGGVPGEVLSPTQPFPVAPLPLTGGKVTGDDAFGITPWDRGACRERIEAARNDGLYTPPTLQGTILSPMTGGGANWGGAAYDPGRNLLFVNTTNILHRITLIPRTQADRTDEDSLAHDAEFAPMRGTAYGMTRELVLSPLGLPCNKPPWGEMHAIDMATGRLAWERPLGTTEDLAPLGISLNWGVPNIGGPAATAGGLVFIGAAMDRYLRAFDSRSGEELWQGRLPAGGQATPMTYVWQGRQYVVIAAGGHSEADTPRGDWLVAFALPAEGEAGPAWSSRWVDRPGGRFAWLAAGAAAIALLLVAAIRAFLTMRRR